MKWHTGCSGFHYREWKGVFYPNDIPQKKWFEYYSQHFDTLELNVTFYRFPQLSYLENWYTKSPAHFLFSAKVPRLITHYKKLKNCERMLDDFYRTLRLGLREKLGAVLFQLPPQLIYTEETLETLVGSVNRNFQNVMEFRHASWWQKHVMRALAEKDISFCGISYPGLPTEPVMNTKWMYYRFHGRPKLYYSSYGKEQLKKLAGAIKKSRKVREAYIYFNNTASTAAIDNAVSLKKIIQGASTSKTKISQL